MAVKPPAERPEPISSRINSVSSQFSDGGQAVSPSARSSISSWSEEPAHSNMDISTGHMILVSFISSCQLEFWIKLNRKSIVNNVDVTLLNHQVITENVHEIVLMISRRNCKNVEI